MGGAAADRRRPSDLTSSGTAPGELPGLAKNYVMRMLFLEQPLPQAAVALWVKKESHKEHEENTQILSGLRLWHTQQLPGGLQGLILNPIFRENLKIALLGG
ncbi:unnamed protein product [Ranitomeya imitator]|uniref:General transcription factor IIH subunit 4 n=1 Tax=Ranitomeya imitator TaxID=111125 RepID=A0ABN9LAR6_9NEOB|nr:unnamed protein product [Ranitomeya imitator]